MKKKYICLFIVSSVFTFLVLASFFLLSFISRDGSVYNFVDFLKVNYFTDVLIILAVSLFITVMLLLFKKKYDLDVTSLIFPISYLSFMAFIILIAFILNNFVVVKNMHFVYYYRFIIFDYLLLCIYTILSFKSKKRR